jgi:hypothetical protein
MLLHVRQPPPQSFVRGELVKLREPAVRVVVEQKRQHVDVPALGLLILQLRDAQLGTCRDMPTPPGDEQYAQVTALQAAGQ